MLTKSLRFAVVVVLVLGLALVLPCSDVFAAGRGGNARGDIQHGAGGHVGGRGGDGGRGNGGGGRGNGGDEYAWIGIAVAGVLLGAALLAAAQPLQYQTVYMPGNPVPYYYNNGRYYQKDMCGNYYPVQPVQYIQPVMAR